MAAKAWLLIIAGVAVVLLSIGAFRVSRQARTLHGRQMSLLDHLRELRYRLLAILATAASAAILAFVLDVRGGVVLGHSTWVPTLSVTDSIASRALRLLLDSVVPPGVQIVLVTPFEGVSASLLAALIVGMLVASPFIAYHIAAFVAPALHANERRVVATIAPMSLVLFLAGAAFAVGVIVPVALRFLYSYAGALDAEPFARPGDILTFTGLTGLLMGLAFQLPLVMTALSRVGLVEPRSYARHWRGVVVVTLIVAAVVTPDPTVTSQMLVAAPTLLLFFLGIGLAYAVRRKPA
ncbi:MAG: twin-arginine translocase subunit TatC [bacterium]